MNSFTILLVVVQVLAIAHISTAISCYSCGSGTSQTCSTQTECGSGEVCYKVATVTNGFGVYTKGCASSCNNGQSQTLGPTTVTYYCCSSDNCNFALSQFGIGSTARIMLLVSAILTFGVFRLY